MHARIALGLFKRFFTFFLPSPARLGAEELVKKIKRRYGRESGFLRARFYTYEPPTPAPLPVPVRGWLQLPY